MQSVLIYGLHDPRTGELRYIGKTGQHGRARSAQHLSRARKGQRTRLATWLRALMAVGLVPELRVIEETTTTDWQERERHWIAQYKAQGARLTNGTDGGDGGATMKGKRFTAAHRQAISAALKGHTVSEHNRQVLRKLRAGKALKPRMPLDIEAIKAMYVEQRMSSRQIAKRLGVHPSTILSRLHELDIVRHLIPAALVDTAISRMRAR